MAPRAGRADRRWGVSDNAVCSIDGCDKPRYGRYRLCSMHRSRLDRTGSTGPVGPLVPPLSERFWPRVDTTGECWLWSGPVSQHGYGILGVDGERTDAHRVAYALSKGPITAGQVIRHSCDTPRCVRPAHLLEGSQRDNIIDMGTRDRHPNYHPRAVREEIIRRQLAGERVCDIARDLGVKYTMAHAVVHRSRHAAD